MNQKIKPGVYETLGSKQNLPVEIRSQGSAVVNGHSDAPTNLTAIENAPISVIAYTTAEKTHSTTFATAIDWIRTGRFCEDIPAIRAAVAGGDKGTARRLKMGLPAYLFAGSFFDRGNCGLRERSGLICVDIDDIAGGVAEVKEAAGRDPYTVTAFVSPSGTGLKVIYHCAPLCYYPVVFKAAEKHVLDVLKVRIDSQCCDPARLCYTSYDPEIYFNPRAEPLPIPDLPESEPKAEHDALHHFFAMQKVDNVTVDQVRELLSFIPPRPDYGDWVRIASAVWAVLPIDEGCMLLGEWSPAEEPGEYEAKWPDRLKEISVGTLFYYAKQNGWTRNAPPSGAEEEVP